MYTPCLSMSRRCVPTMQRDCDHLAEIACPALSDAIRSCARRHLRLQLRRPEPLGRPSRSCRAQVRSRCHRRRRAHGGSLPSAAEHRPGRASHALPRGARCAHSRMQARYSRASRRADYEGSSDLKACLATQNALGPAVSHVRLVNVTGGTHNEMAGTHAGLNALAQR